LHKNIDKYFSLLKLLKMSLTLTESGNPIYSYQQSNGFPIFPDVNLVDREGFVETIERMFAEVQVVFLEGEEGFGTTTTAAQFCISYPERTFCLFIKPSSRTTYSPDYIRLTLAEQITWFLDNKELSEDATGPTEFRKLVIRLGRKITRKNPVYFVIDGLQKIQNSEPVIEEIFRDILPFWQDNMKFLICGKQATFEKYFYDISCKYIQQLTFSAPEVERFMLPFIVDSSDVRTLHSLTQGIPGRLASVRRLMLGKMTLNEILSATPEKFPSFVKLEFAQVERLSDMGKKILSTVTFSGRQLSRQHLIELTNTDDFAVDEVLSACHFISETGLEKRIDFVSEAHRRFSCTMLEADKNDVINTNIGHLLKSPDSRDSVSYLPIYFQQLNQAAELIRFLTPEHLTHLLLQTSSLGAVRARSQVGMKASIELTQPNDVLGFSLLQNVFLSIAKSEGSIAQIRALVALGEHQTALGIAYNCVTNEERLKFLSAYAKKCKEVTNTLNEEVLSAIKTAAKEIDFSQLGDTAIDIASEIVYVDQDIALSIMDDVLKGASVSDRDAALVRLSLSAPVKKGARLDNRSHAQISDTKLQEFVSSILAVVSDYTHKDIIDVCGRLDQSRQLLFLAYWITEHKNSQNAIDVIEHGLNLMISNSTHNPRMREFRDLAVALPFCSDLTRVEALVKRFDGQRGLITDVAMSTDLVGLQMILAHSETRYDNDSAALRVLDCYVQLSDTSDADTKLQGLALMLRALNEMDGDDILEKENGFKCTIRSEFSTLFSEVLNNSADHFLIMKNVISEFSRFDLSEAINIAKSLNVEDRRDKAFTRICISLQEGEISERMVCDVCQTVSNICDLNERHNIFSEFVHNLSVRKAKLGKPSIEIIEQAFLEVEDSYLRPKIIISIYRLRTLAELGNESKIASWFNKSIVNVIASYYQSDFYFDMCDSSSKVDIDLAKEFYRLGTEVAASAPLPTQEYAQILTWCLTFTARAIGGAVSGDCFKDEMLVRFMQLTEILPSMPTKISLISDLASRMWIAGRGDLAKSLMGQQVIPVVEAALSSYAPNGKILVTLCAPALYCTHPHIAISKIRQLSRQEREPILGLAFDLLLTKTPRSDPNITDIKEQFVITYDEVLGAIALMEIMEEDWNIYSAVHQIVTSIVHKKNSNNFTAQQKVDIADKIGIIYKKRLPDKCNIQHNGYLILCQAQDLRLRSIISIPAWEKFISDALSVSNVADRGYILCEISTILPQKMANRKNEIRLNALTLFNQVPSVIDRINRLIALSNGTSKDAISIAKQSLKSAMTMTLYMLDEHIARDARRKIIDIADKIRPEFADELADLIDQDTARKFARMEVKQRIDMLAVKKKISDVKSNQTITTSEIKHLSEASWKNLHSLLGDRLEIKTPTLMIDYLEQSSRFNLHDAVPVLSWFIENTVKKYSVSKDASGAIRDLTQNLLISSEFSANSMVSMAAKNSRFSKISIGDFPTESLLGLNNRVDALAYVERWLTECDEEIILCDPYFGCKDNDFDFFRLVLRACPNCEIVILTSKEIFQKQGIVSGEMFVEKWRQVCELDLPIGRIISIGKMSDSASLIHDRWLISGNRGLKLGTSFNGIGTGKLSGISILSDGELIQSRNKIMKFINNDRFIDGERVSSSSFTI
jgi:hypothetical protein